MRIQHNIMAMNSYRNYSSNTSALSKNLEKLSSGYKINRAGDDAAGLAISEKMRAQISGLEQAQSNAKSGINLVQTAEGALTEVHSMLNRMVTLADQSANGTYDNETDRANLQKEVSQLKSEVDRIADSSNFNGIKLLDGSLSGGDSTNAAVTFSKATQTLTAATKQLNTVTFVAESGGDHAVGDKLSFEVTYKDANNQLQSKTFNFTLNSDTEMTAEDGSKYTITTKKAGAAELAGAVTDQMTKSGITDFAMNGTAAAATFTANEAGSNKGSIVAITMSKNGAAATALANATTAAGKDAFNTISTAATHYTGAAGTKAEDFVMNVNGQKFAFATAGNTGAFADDVHVVVATAANPTAAEVKDMVATINRVVGSNVASVNTAANTSIDFISNGTSDSKGGLTLQIGDTTDKFNQLTVNVGDMHTKALGISELDISTQTGAKSAVDAVKSAINSVSSTRGTLGALQNRLDHTINNLGVMQENIQDAESTVRDTDVAKEMMAYTKNNILVQSAQAMLAQANQVHQGVLQLLQ